MPVRMCVPTGNDYLQQQSICMGQQHEENCKLQQPPNLVLRPDTASLGGFCAWQCCAKLFGAHLDVERRLGGADARVAVGQGDDLIVGRRRVQQQLP